MYVFLKLFLLISFSRGKNVSNIGQNSISVTNSAMLDASTHTVQTFSTNMDDKTTSSMMMQSSLPNRSHDNFDDVNELLEIIEKSLISYGEDLVEGCIDEAELHKILPRAKNGKLSLEF